MPATFIAGIHPPTHKAYSEKQIIREMPAPQKVYIPLSQHIGKPARVLVSVGDKVKIGQLIAKADGQVSADVFASVGGKVVEIKEMPTANGKCVHVVIENDGSTDVLLLEPLSESANAQAIIERIRDAGIIGMGGAGFPAAFKLSTAKNINTYVINAAECEPYITCDHRIMLEYTVPFLRGCMLLKRAADAERLIIAIEDNKQDAIAQVMDIIGRENLPIEVMPLGSKYPQGAEKQIIYTVTGHKIAPGKLPSSVGAIVSNVHSALAVYFAVVEGQPCYRRIMTVSGKGIKTPANLWVANGTLFDDIIEFCGGMSQENTVKMISGGPMTGTALAGGLYATAKTTGSLLLLTEDEAFTGESSPCIRCGKCAKACPMRLMPMFIDAYSLVGDITNAVRYGARNCIECGCCAYVCPAKRPLVQSIRLAKRKDAAQGGKK